MWRGRVARIVDWLYSRSLVGKDLQGNAYYIYYRANEPEKRMVEYINKYDQDAKHLPIEGYSWLVHSRADFPKETELRESEEKRRILQMRVAAIEAEDNKQRLRQILQKTDKDYDETPQSRGYTSEQVHLLVKGSSEKDSKLSRGESSGTKGKEGSDSFEPEAWNPEDKSRPRYS
mmetsp:Transcript_18514/g.32140  ORF Transcript_18514/g.32140 Transcript_18514/m.32140 type:complete len:175 (-) Transcript_18514:680-1204(-)